MYSRSTLSLALALIGLFPPAAGPTWHSNSASSASVASSTRRLNTPEESLPDTEYLGKPGRRRS